MTEALTQRHEFVYYFEVRNGNPNGDPDADNMPRVDPETGRGLVTDVCLKRKVRNYVLLAEGDKAPNGIFVKEKAILNLVQEQGREAAQAVDPELTAKVKKDKKKAEPELVEKAGQWMCGHYFDIRTFGAVMSTGANCGQVRGPVQLGFSMSLDPILPLPLTITRMAVTTEAESDKQSGGNRTMGRKHIVPYGLYRLEGYVSAYLAQKTGFGTADLELFWQALLNMFDHDRSAARCGMAARRLIVFRHETALGRAPAHQLFELVTCHRRPDVEVGRSFEDYELTFKREALPTGVEALEKL